MNKYAGKYFSILGDSISTYEGYNLPGYLCFYEGIARELSGVTTVDDTWWMLVINELGGKLLVNESCAGTCIAGKTPMSGCSNRRISLLGTAERSPDVILVSMGSNDRGFGVKLDSPKNSDTNYFSNAMRMMLKRLRTTYPEAELWCSTFAPGHYIEGPVPLFYDPVNRPPAEPYLERIRAIAAEQQCNLADLASLGREYEALDGSHPTKEGMRALADMWLHFLKN